jgi:hypothetical protein
LAVGVPKGLARHHALQMTARKMHMVRVKLWLLPIGVVQNSHLKENWAVHYETGASISLRLRHS